MGRTRTVLLRSRPNGLGGSTRVDALTCNPPRSTPVEHIWDPGHPLVENPPRQGRSAPGRAFGRRPRSPPFSFAVKMEGRGPRPNTVADLIHRNVRCFSHRVPCVQAEPRRSWEATWCTLGRVSPGRARRDASSGVETRLRPNHRQPKPKGCRTLPALRIPRAVRANLTGEGWEICGRAVFASQKVACLEALRRGVGGRRLSAIVVVLVTVMGALAASGSLLGGSHGGGTVQGPGPGRGGGSDTLAAPTTDRAALKGVAGALDPTSAAVPHVKDSLVLLNNTVVPGNFPALNGIQLNGEAYDGGRGEVFVADELTNNVSVISDSSYKVVAGIPVGSEPWAVAYDSGKGEIFVTDDGSNNVSVISDTNDTVVATVPVGSAPVGVAYDSAKGEVFVTASPTAYLTYGIVSVICDGSTSCGGSTDLNKVVATVAVGPVPSSAAYDNAKGEVFVTNSWSKNVSVICDGSTSCGGSTDLNKVVATVAVGTYPSGVAYDGAKGEVFVANAGNYPDYLGNVSVINDTSDKVAVTVPVGSWPNSVTYDSRKGEVLVTNSDSNNVSVINDTSDKVVATIPVGIYPGGAAYDAARGYVFVANSESNNVSVIWDASNGVVATVQLGSNPIGLTYDSAKGQVFVADAGSNNVSVISDTSDKVVATIPVVAGLPVGNSPYGLAYDRGQGEVFVTEIGGSPNYYGNVSVIDDSSDEVVATVVVGSDPFGVAYDSATGEVFVSSWGTNPHYYGNVSVICDGSTSCGGTADLNKVVATVPVGLYATGVAYDSAKGEVFVSDMGDPPLFYGNVSVIDDTSDKVVATVAVGFEPAGVVYDGSQGEVLVTDSNSSNVSVISDTSNTVVATIPVGSEPLAAAYDNGQGQVFVINALQGTVSIIAWPSATSSSSSGLSTLDYAIIGVVVVVAAVAVAAVLLHRRVKAPPKSPETPPPPSGAGGPPTTPP